MELGTFSVSLAVKDIEASKLFYEQLGFTPAATQTPPVVATAESPSCRIE